MIAIIGDSPNAASIGLHARHDFRLAGPLPAVGYKFGRWIDSVIMTHLLRRTLAKKSRLERRPS